MGGRSNFFPYRNHWFWVIVVIVVGFAVVLGLLEGLALSFSVLSIIVSVFFASRSLIIAGRSLQLSVATNRPFLNIDLSLVKVVILDRAILIPKIQNTGNSPADEVLVDCSWYLQTDNHVEPCPLELEESCHQIIFPAEKAEPTYLVVGREAVDKLTRKGSRVKVTVKYQNKITKQSHTTHRTFSIALAFNTTQAIAISEEDYWD